jgi:hypothetical protein
MRKILAAAARSAVAALAFALLVAPAAVAQSEDPLDVLIVIDNTGSMGGVIEKARQGAAQIVGALEEDFPDTRFALATVADGSDAWSLVQPFTAEASEVVNALVDEDHVNASADGSPGWPEAYVRAVHEARALGWRDGADRVVVLINDDLPKDDDINEGVPAEYQRDGVPPDTLAAGPDVDANGQPLDWQEELESLKNEGIVLAVVFNGYPDYLSYWEWWTKQTDGVAQQLADDALAPTIRDLVERSVPPPDPVNTGVVLGAIGLTLLAGAGVATAVARSPTRRQRLLVRRHVRLEPVVDATGTHYSSGLPDAKTLPTVRLEPRAALAEHRVLEGTDAND